MLVAVVIIQSDGKKAHRKNVPGIIVPHFFYRVDIIRRKSV